MSERQPSSASVQAAEELLDLALAEANEARREDVQARLHATRSLLHDSRLRVQVVGGHRQGKSALIEALMMSAREDARPSACHASRLDLVEVPAIGATSTPQQAHVVLFVSDSAAPLTGEELARLRTAVEGCPMTVFVQTKIDACAGWRDVLNHNIALMRDAGLSVETWVVSSIGRLRGGWTGDERLTVGSGLPALVGQLQMLWTDFEVTGLRIVSHHLLAVITELDGLVRKRRAELAEPAVAEDLVARIAELDARHQDLRERAVRWPPLLANGFATIHADVAFDLRCRVERVRTQLDRTLGDRRPFENWRPMARWLRHRLTLDAQANGELALAASAEFAARAAEHFGLRRPELEPPDEEDPDSAIPRPPRPDAGDQRVVTLSASVNVLMRSWMGFMMYFLIDGIAHLGWSPLVGLIPGGALALTAVIEERRQYIARERSRAAMILHKYVDVASVKAANNSGERLRRLEQRMREHYGRYIDWCEAEMHRERRAVEVRSAELEARPALLKEIDAGLRYYDTLRHRVSTLVAAHLLAVAESTQQQGPRAAG
jgi:hypothetical protein